MKRIITLLGILTAVFTTASAQQNINSQLEVKKDYDNSLPVIHKSKLNTTFNDSLNNFALNFNYTVFNKEYKDLYEFAPMASANIQSPVTPYNNTFFAKLGVSFPLGFDGYAAFSPELARLNKNSKFLGNSRIMIYASNNSFWGKIKNQEVDGNSIDGYTTKKGSEKSNASQTRTNVGLIFNHCWETGRINANINYKHGKNDFYGKNIYLGDTYVTDYTDVESHKFNEASLDFAINSLPDKTNKRQFNYNGSLNFACLTDNSLEKISANRLFADWTMGPSIGRYSKLLVNLNLRNAYSKILGESKYYGLFSISPSYNFDYNNWMFKVGGTYSAKYSNRAVGKYYNSLFANADIRFKAIKEKLILFANVGGGNTMNDYIQLLNENPWISPFANNIISSVPISGAVGVCGNFGNLIDYKASAGYVRHNGIAQYVTAKENPSAFDLEYNNTNQLYFAANVGVNTRQFTGNLKMQFNDYNGHKPYNYPTFESTFYGEYNYMHRIYVGLSLYARSKTNTMFVNDYFMNGTEYEYTYFENTKIKNFVNVGLNAKYVINSNFTAYVSADNLFGGDVCYYQQYLKKGVSFGAGVLVKF